MKKFKFGFTLIELLIVIAILGTLAVALLAALCTLAARGEAQGETAPRGSLSAGMGVSYLAPKDIVALVNVTAIPSERLSPFHAAGEFFGAAAYPLSVRDVVQRIFFASANSRGLLNVDKKRIRS